MDIRKEEGRGRGRMVRSYKQKAKKEDDTEQIGGLKCCIDTIVKSQK